MSEPVYGLTAESARTLQDMANKHRQRLPDVGRRLRRIGGQGNNSQVRIIGPCSVYTIPAGDPDSAFDVDFGSGCDGPSRYGLTFRNLETNTYGAYDLMLDTTSPLVYLTDNFTHQCQSSTLTLYGKLTVTNTDVDGVALTLHKASDDSQVVLAKNSIYRWLPLVGGNLQNLISPCNCTTFPYDFCVAPPNR